MRLNIGGRKLHAGGGQCAFARILLGNGVRKCGIYSILRTTREAELRFRFSYLQLLGLYSKSPKLAFNQWGANSSPARLTQLNQSADVVIVLLKLVTKCL